MKNKPVHNKGHYLTCRLIQRGWRQEVQTVLLEYCTCIGILNNLSYQSQSYQANIKCWAIICPPVNFHLNGVSFAGWWWPALSDPLSHHQLKKTTKKTRCQIWVEPPLTKPSESAHGRIDQYMVCSSALLSNCMTEEQSSDPMAMMTKILN